MNGSVFELLVQIPNRRAFPAGKQFEIMLVFQHKGHDKIQYNGTSEGEKRQIDEVHTNRCTFNTQFSAPPGTNAKGVRFKPANNSVDHAANLRICQVIWRKIGRL